MSKLNIPKFQLDMTGIPAVLDKVVRQKVQDILIKNGYADKFDNCMDKNFLIMGLFHERTNISWNHAIFFSTNYQDAPCYDVLKDWDTWTQLKVSREKFEPIILTFRTTQNKTIIEDTRVTVNENEIFISTPETVNSNLKFKFDSIEKIYQAVQKAKQYRAENN